MRGSAARAGNDPGVRHKKRVRWLGQSQRPRPVRRSTLVRFERHRGGRSMASMCVVDPTRRHRQAKVGPGPTRELLARGKNWPTFLIGACARLHGGPRCRQGQRGPAPQVETTSRSKMLMPRPRLSSRRWPSRAAFANALPAVDRHRGRAWPDLRPLPRRRSFLRSTRQRDAPACRKRRLPSPTWGHPAR